MKEVVAEAYIKDLLQRIEEQNKTSEYTLTANTVTMKRRFRDMSASDLLDVFTEDNQWTKIDTRNYYRLNIIKPMVRGNTAALASANTKINIGPRYFASAKSKMAAEVARAIRDKYLGEQWTLRLQEQLATEAQVGPGVFLYVEWDDEAPGETSQVVDWVKEKFKTGGEATCATCGYVTEYGEGEEKPACEHCGAETEITKEPMTDMIDVIGSVTEKNNGAARSRVVPAAEVRIDDRNTQHGNIEAARWLDHHYLMPVSEISERYGGDEKDYASPSSKWSYPLRWHHTLQTGHDVVNNAPMLVDDYGEIHDLYLTYEMYRGRKMEQVFKAGDFSVARGKEFHQGTYKGRPLEGKPTLCFRTVDDKILDVFPADFKRRFIYFSFLSNPTSFWGLFLTEMLPLQDIVTYMLTLQVFHTRRNARTTLIFDSDAFDAEDFEKDITGTREDFTSPDRGVSATFGVVPAIPLNSEPMNMIATIMQVRGDIGGQQPAMVGGGTKEQGYETFSGQLMAKNQSLMQLAPYTLSEAYGKTKWVTEMLRLAQERWTEGEYISLLKENPDWTEEHVAAFRECKLSRDLIIEHEVGSEAPRTLLEREFALRQFVQDLSILAQMSPDIVTPQLVNDIVERMKQATDLDVDVSNIEIQGQLSESRFMKLMEIIETAPDMDNETETDMETLDQLAMMIIGSSPDLIPFEGENHIEAMEFLNDKILAEGAKKRPNRLKIACLEALMQAHSQIAPPTPEEQAIKLQQEAQEREYEHEQELAAREQQAQADADVRNAVLDTAKESAAEQEGLWS